ncbi:MraY family glycosyltransferase [Tenacibaculum soleae]|uniref:glycosyltransferase family 4 protein n=1 Tax=Tenacibaculum soleae TaxID=447689 RepID=UPI0026E2FE2A|nr:MraY family glycosyltransferase [Tenacibaculum soleae]MDO6743448.1 MraY family glycosyltransferase [Tenacibaculum soleae]
MELMFINILIILISSFITTYLIVPKIIKVVSYKKLLDEPNKRSSHKKITPTLGGIAFFITIILSFFFLKKWDTESFSLNLMVSLTVLFIIGLKDDLIAVSAKTKALAQVLAISFLIYDNNLLIESLGGFLGVTAINYWVYIAFIYFSIFFIINSFNLIDGVDGLAASIAITIFTFLGVMFFFLNQYYYTYLCIVIVGTLLAFLYYNLSENKKIFMGDTGSMIIGFLIGVLSFKLLTFHKNIESIGLIPSENILIVLCSLISIPILDTIRVFVVRTINKKSFFIADRNHVHHIFVDYGCSHKKTTLLIVIFNLIITICIYSLSFLLNSFFLLLVFIMISLIFYSFLLYLKRNTVKLEEDF